jgi:hypothetical protein
MHALLIVAGQLPSSIGSLYQLEELRLTGAFGISGSIPSTWSSLTGLRALELSSLSGLTGGLPSSWIATGGGMTQLSELILRDLPHLELPPRPLPYAVAPSTRLTRVALVNLKSVQGITLDQQLPQHHPNLTELWLSRLGLAGSLPTAWSAPGNGSRLRLLDLSANALSGSLPGWVWTALAPGAVLDLSRNSLTGMC